MTFYQPQCFLDFSICHRTNLKNLCLSSITKPFVLHPSHRFALVFEFPDNPTKAVFIYCESVHQSSCLMFHSVNHTVTCVPVFQCRPLCNSPPPFLSPSPLRHAVSLSLLVTLSCTHSAIQLSSHKVNSELLITGRSHSEHTRESAHALRCFFLFF